MLRYIGCNIIIWCLSGYNAIAHIIDCKTIQCRNTNINCLPNEHCFIQCDEMESCIGSTINCPLNGDCNIKCEGGNSCRDAIVNARLSSGNFNLLCSESTDHCKGIKIYGSILHSNTGNFNVSCNGKVRACSNSEIKCPINGDCSINCNGDTSCRWLEITGPMNGDLNINCNAERSCFDGIFDGRQSSKVSITGCMEFESCFDLSLYCPPKSGNGIKNCFIEGNNNIGKDNDGGTKIYAVNGWDDIEIDYYGIYGTIHGGKMFCGDNYDKSCNIASDNWLCVDPINCGLQTTLNPTSTPTIFISKNPWNISSILDTIKSEIEEPTLLPTELYTSTITGTVNKEQYVSQTESSTIIISELKSTPNIEIKKNNNYINALNKENDKRLSLVARLLFGIAILIIIIVVGLCCYLTNKYRKPFISHHRNNAFKSWPKVICDDEQYSNTNTTTKECDNYIEEIIISTQSHKDTDSLIDNNYIENNNENISSFKDPRSPNINRSITIKSTENIQNHEKEEKKIINTLNSHDIPHLNQTQIQITKKLNNSSTDEIEKNRKKNEESTKSQ